MAKAQIHLRCKILKYYRISSNYYTWSCCYSLWVPATKPNMSYTSESFNKQVKCHSSAKMSYCCGGVTKSSSSSLNICLLQAMKTGDGEGLEWCSIWNYMYLLFCIIVLQVFERNWRCSSNCIPSVSHKLLTFVEDAVELPVSTTVGFHLCQVWKCSLQWIWCAYTRRKSAHIPTVLLSPTTSCSQQCFGIA